MNEYKKVLIDFCCYFQLLLGGESERENFSLRKFILEISDVVCSKGGLRSMLMNFKLYAKLCYERERESGKGLSCYYC